MVYLKPMLKRWLARRDQQQAVDSQPSAEMGDQQPQLKAEAMALNDPAVAGAAVV
jgi:hypothetical protein